MGQSNKKNSSGIYDSIYDYFGETYSNHDDNNQFVGSDEFYSYGTGYFCQDLFINGT